MDHQEGGERVRETSGELLQQDPAGCLRAEEGRASQRLREEIRRGDTEKIPGEKTEPLRDTRKEKGPGAGQDHQGESAQEDRDRGLHPGGRGRGGTREQGDPEPRDTDPEVQDTKPCGEQNY